MTVKKSSEIQKKREKILKKYGMAVGINMETVCDNTSDKKWGEHVCGHNARKPKQGT